MNNSVENREVAVKLSGVKKMYKLGQIGGGTLKADIQSWWAKKRGKVDPNSKIGQEDRLVGETFMALNGLDLTIYQGEAVGIIGGNGAGKSTMLKLLSRVTGPTEGTIDIYGRVASMLEVGTGFNAEMTGRENVYMNGAILGMTKAEIDAKMEDIIEFSEVRDFIDTPVKRYSSGMFVKLAFSVASHLDAEIMIMDEVLAVGDVAFQKKCLDKMRQAAKVDGRTVLYVSHNMNTIRQLCDRCIVLDKGKVIYEGDVEDSIQRYLGINNSTETVINLKDMDRESAFKNHVATMEQIEILGGKNWFEMNSFLNGRLKVSSTENFNDVVMKLFLLHNESAVTTVESEPVISLKKDKSVDIDFSMNLDRLAPATYTIKLVLCRRNEYGAVEYLDVLLNSFMFEIIASEDFQSNQKWSTRYNGFLIGDKIEIKNQGE